MGAGGEADARGAGQARRPYPLPHLDPDALGPAVLVAGWGPLDAAVGGPTSSIVTPVGYRR